MEERSMYNLVYKSILAQDFYNFVQMKRNLGYKYTTAAYLIRELDTFLCSKNINVPILTKELCEEWMQRHPHEAGSTYRGRCMILIEFSRFMSNIGKPSFIPRMPRIQSRGFTAHIFTDDEIGRFFASCEKPEERLRYHHVASALQASIWNGATHLRGTLVEMQGRES